ncbi:MAG TPA: hypothetical protein VGG73_11405 [Vicinamibacterales bacterium]|jgi:hypothetical protein
MRSSAIRLTLGAAAWIVLIVAGFLIFRSEQQITSQRSALRAFDQHARDATAALSDLRTSQQAYVAAGQGVNFWMPKVATTQAVVMSAIDALNQSANATARTALDQAAATISDFGKVDQRARDYLKGNQPLMAADVIFTEGGESAASATRQVETARLEQHQAQDAAEAASRWEEAIILATAGAFAGITLLFMIPVPQPVASVVERLTSLTMTPPLIARPIAVASPTASATALASSPSHSTASAAVPAPVPVPAPVSTPAAAPSAAGTALRAAADLATDFGRLRDVSDLTRLLGRAADMMDASGLMVWMGNATGADLRPVLAHGYSDAMLARIPPVAQSADNAAAAAYRSATTQVVGSRPGGTNGAVVAPIISADGCIGALSAEIRGGGEGSDSVRALAVIFASHLAGVLAATTAPAAEINQPKAAASN